MKINDAVVGVALIALAIAILVHIQAYPLIPGQKYGPALFPGLIAVGLHRPRQPAARPARRQRRASRSSRSRPWMRVAWRWSTNFLAGLRGARVLHRRRRRRSASFPTASLMSRRAVPEAAACARWRALVTAVVATLVIHLLFYKLLRVPLPWGVLERFAW